VGIGAEAAGRPAPGRHVEAEHRVHPEQDRFLAGTDTWVTSRWEALPGSVSEVRTYLNQLPRDVAEKIAYKNAERLFP
jgi:hypothetical protein